MRGIREVKLDQSGPQPELDIKFPVISLANSSTKTLA